VKNQDGNDYEIDLRAQLGISALELLDLSVDVMVVIDASGRLEFVSAAAEQLVGIPASALIGTHIVDFVHADDLRVSVLSSRATSRNPGMSVSLRGAVSGQRWKRLADPSPWRPATPNS
jgi:PAS domain S-box-containing protein